MPRGSSIDIIFDRSTVYRLWASEKKSPDLIARLTTEFVYHNETQQDPLYGPLNGSRIYHAILETYQSPLVVPQQQPLQVAVKWVRGQYAIDKLRYEAALYTEELLPLQGDVVPKFYGIFAANIDGVAVGCLVLEWCKGMYLSSMEELNRKRMLAASRLHRAGVIHGNLRDGHHFLIASDGGIRIVDFASAQFHMCSGEFPALYINREGEVPLGCDELYDLEIRFGRNWSRGPAQIY